jgi:hypothetical protein
MAQKIFFNHEDVIKSFDYGRWLNGILAPGRYTGFDTKSYSGLTLSLTHAGSGFVQSDINGALTAATGIFISPQGGVVQENGTISIGAITANSSGNPRIDLIWADYLKPVAAIGSATYGKTNGTPGAVPVAPANPDNTRKIVLGTLLVPDGTTTDLAGCTFTPAAVPLLGNAPAPVAYSEADYSLVGANWTSDNAIDTDKVKVRKNLTGPPTIQFLDNILNAVDNSEAIFTLAADLRPAKDIINIISASDVAGAVFFPARLSIKSNGDVRLMMPAWTAAPGSTGTSIRAYITGHLIPIS